MHKVNTERATNRNNHTWIIYPTKNLESLNSINELYLKGIFRILISNIRD